MPEAPKLPLGDPPTGEEMVVARQSGYLRRFALSSLVPFFKGAKGDTGATGPKGDTGAVGPIGPNPWTNLGTIVVTEKLVVSVAVPSVRTISLRCTGLKKGDTVTVSPVTSMPPGYSLGSAVASQDDTIEVQVTCPALAIGASYAITARVLVARVQ